MYCDDDGRSFAADLSLLREYFIARDAKGVPHGLGEDVVLQATSYLEQLVTLTLWTSDELAEACAQSAPLKGPHGRHDGRVVPPLPSYDPSSPVHKCNVVRLLLLRVKLEPAAARFVEKNKAQLRELLESERSLRQRQGGVTRVGQGVAELRQAKEAALEAAALSAAALAATSAAGEEARVAPETALGSPDSVGRMDAHDGAATPLDAHDGAATPLATPIRPTRTHEEQRSEQRVDSVRSEVGAMIGIAPYRPPPVAVGLSHAAELRAKRAALQATGADGA
jgi:hypothetical protein